MRRPTKREVWKGWHMRLKPSIQRLKALPGQHALLRGKCQDAHRCITNRVLGIQFNKLLRASEQLHRVNTGLASRLAAPLQVLFGAVRLTMPALPGVACERNEGIVHR